MDNPDNMKEIFKMAQQVAKNINIPRDSNGQTDPSQVDMSKIFSEVSRSVSKMVTPEFVEKFSGGDEQQPRSIKQKKNSRIVVESDDELEPAEDTLPKTKDLHFTLNVSLKHLYHGKTKNIAVKRQRYTTVDGKPQLQEDRKILAVNIKPGMQDDDVIVFEGEGDEKKGYVPGDVIITLCYDDNNTYERIGNDLFITHNISLSECYDIDFTFKHINGQTIGIKRTGDNIMSGNNLFKLKGFGMPIQDEEAFGNLYIKFDCEIPDSLDSKQVEILKTIIPPISDKEETDNYHAIEEVTEEEMDSFYYNPDEDDNDEDDDEDEEEDEY